MDSSLQAPPPALAVLAKTFTKLLSLRRTSRTAISAAADSPYKPKPSSELSSALPASSADVGGREKETEALTANLFAGVSAVKAAYAQLQLAQAPYDPDTIQSADSAIVNELKRLSELKQSFLKHHLAGSGPPPLAAQIQEQCNLLKTYKITTAKLEAELRSKDSEVVSLQSELRVAEKRCRALEVRLRPGRTLAALDDLHLSGLNPTHFLTLLRSAVKSIRSFAKALTFQMESAGWDLDAAATAIQPDLLRRRNPSHRLFAFESYVSRIMFSDFQSPGFGVGGAARERLQFFAEFAELRFVNAKECFESKRSRFGKFCRGKYMRLVHPKMEASFFGDLEHRAAVSSGAGWPETEFFEGLAEMARRVWLLHCLFFAFGEEEKGAIFEARRGSRFSEVYMESVAVEEEAAAAVGFTVLPGFRVGRTVIQCRVYLVSHNN